MPTSKTARSSPDSSSNSTASIMSEPSPGQRRTRVAAIAPRLRDERGRGALLRQPDARLFPPAVPGREALRRDDLTVLHDLDLDRIRLAAAVDELERVAGIEQQPLRLEARDSDSGSARADRERPEAFAARTSRRRPRLPLVEHERSRVRGIAVLRAADDHLVLDALAREEPDRADVAGLLPRVAERAQPYEHALGGARARAVRARLAVRRLELPLLELADELRVRLDDLERRPPVDDLAALEPDRLRAEADDVIERVRHHEHRRAALDQPGHAGDRLRQEVRVAGAEHLVDDEDLRLDARRDCEAETGLHAGRIRAEGLVEERAELREFCDVLLGRADLALVEALVRECGADVLLARELWM